MQRADDLEVTLADGSFTGSLTYSFTVPTGSDCSDQLAASGGQYSTLPCTVNVLAHRLAAVSTRTVEPATSGSRRRPAGW